MSNEQGIAGQKIMTNYAFTAQCELHNGDKLICATNPDSYLLVQAF